ncbi:MAG: NUDIX hydrolase [Thermoplasmata archaeon]|nr:NUDIX hydrolase [Thermoplasmata archaeon]
MEKPDKIVDRVLHGVDAVVFNDNMEVLMLRRNVKGENFRTGWEFIKGALKVDEDHLNAALREIREEAAIDVRYIGEIEETMEVDARYRRKPRYDYVRKRALVFLYVGGDIKIDKSEHEEYKWMKLDEAMEKVWVESGREIIAGSKEVMEKWRGKRS